MKPVNMNQYTRVTTQLTDELQDGSGYHKVHPPLRHLRRLQGPNPHRKSAVPGTRNSAKRNGAEGWKPVKAPRLSTRPMVEWVELLAARKITEAELDYQHRLLKRDLANGWDRMERGATVELTQGSHWSTRD